MPPWKTDIERAIWVLSDSDPDRIPEPTDGRTMRLIGDLYCFQSKRDPRSQSQKFWKHKRLLIGTYDENGRFNLQHVLERKHAYNFVLKYERK